MALYEYYTTSGANDIYVYAAEWLAQTFTVGTVGSNENFNVTGCSLWAFRAANPGTLNVSIRAVDGSGQPSGSDLSTGSINANTFDEYGPLQETISMSSYQLQASTKYAIVARAINGDVSNFVAWRYVPSATYTGGDIEWSSNSGSTFTAFTDIDFMFAVYGTTSGGAATSSVYLTQSLSLTDVYSKAKITSLSKLDTLSSSDNVLRNKITSVSNSDAINLSDLFNSQINKVISLLDNLSLSDAFSKNKITSKGISEALSLTDNFLKNKITFTSLTDSLTLSEAFYSQTTIIRSIFISESLSLSDSISKQFVFNRLISDSLSLNDILSKASILNRAFIDNITLLDTNYIYKAVLSVYCSDSITLTDDFSISRVLLTFAVSLSDEIILSEVINISGHIPTIYGIASSEALTLIDLFTGTTAVIVEKGSMLMFGGRYAKSKMGKLMAPFKLSSEIN